MAFFVRSKICHLYAGMSKPPKRIQNKMIWCFGFLFLALVSGCVYQEPRPLNQQELHKDRPISLIQKEKKVPPPGLPPFHEKMVPVSNGLRKEMKLYSLSFDGVPFGETLHALIKGNDLNLSVELGIDLSVPITVRLQAATFEEALDMIVEKGAGYSWKIEGNFLHIKRFEEKIYHLDYLNLARETDIEVGGDMLGSSVEDATVAGKYAIKAKREGKSTDIWEGIKVTLEGLKSKNGNLKINRSAGIIYMEDSPRKIKTMVRFLDSLSESLNRQVYIEARILEVNLSDKSKYGIDWSNFDIAFKSGSNALPDNLSFAMNSGGAIVLSNQSRYEAVIDFLRTQGDVTTLSNPHISVMNGQSAMMTVGFQFPFGDISGVDQDLETKVVTFRTSIKRAILGLQLGITPQISKDGLVTLHIVPTITNILRDEAVELPLSATSTLSISNPIIDLQELATMVRVKEGHSVVLAGLISQMQSLNQESLPWLGKLPILKYLFGHTETSQINRELVIFITPYIKQLS